MIAPSEPEQELIDLVDDPLAESEDGDLPPISDKAHEIAQGRFELSFGKVAALGALVFSSTLAAQWLMSGGRDAAADSPPPKQIITTGAPKTMDATADEARRNAPPIAKSDGKTAGKAPETRLERLQHFLDTGSSSDAVAALKNIPRRTIRRLPLRTQIQIAQAFENERDYKSALILLEEVITDESRDSPASAAMRAQLARLHLREDRPDAASAVLVQILLGEISPAFLRDVHGQVMHLFAIATYQRWEAMRNPGTDLLNDNTLVYPMPEWREYELADVPNYTAAPRNNAAADLPDGLDVINRQRTFPDLSKLRIRATDSTSEQLLEAAFPQVGLTSTWTEPARRIAQNHRVMVNMDEIPFNTLLDRLLVPQGLAWALNRGTVVIDQIIRLNKNQRITFLHGVAERALQSALSIHPDHKFAPMATFCAGVLAWHAKDIAVADSRFSQLMVRYPRNRHRAAAHFNRGRCLMQARDWEGSRRQFTAAGDHATGGGVATVAWIYAGRLTLENDEPRDAIRQLLRAESFALRIHHKATAALQLASAWLLSENPRAANEVLVRHAEILREEKYAPAAALIGAIAHYQSARNETLRKQRAAELLGALVHANAGDFFGATGYFLIGEGWRLLDLPEQMRKTWKSGIASIGGAARVRILSQLAQDEWTRGNALSAAEWLKLIPKKAANSTTQTEKDAATTAKLQLARVALRKEQPKRCLELCHELLAISGPHQADALQLMGTVYQKQNDYKSAVFCFAGIVPDQEAIHGSSPPEEEEP